MKTVIDTWVWIEIISSGPACKKALAMLRKKSLVMTTANVYELKVYLRRHYDAEKSEKIIKSIIAQCDDLIQVTKEIALHAADIKTDAKGDMGAVDCFVLASAQLIGANLISGDPHFRGYQNVELIE